MATQAPQTALPLLYKDLVPISSQEHGGWRIKDSRERAVGGKRACHPR